MKMKMILAAFALMISSGCVAGKTAPPSSPPPQPGGSPPMIAAAAPAAEVKITSAAGEIHFSGQLHVGKTAPPLLAQCAPPSLPAARDGQRAEVETVVDRPAGAAPATDDRTDKDVVMEPVERVDAAPAAEKTGKVPGKLPE